MWPVPGSQFGFRMPRLVREFCTFGAGITQVSGLGRMVMRISWWNSMQEVGMVNPPEKMNKVI